MFRVAGLAPMGGCWAVEAGGADDGELPVSGHPLLVEQPRSARPGKTLGDAIERRLAPVIVVPRDAIHRRLDAGEEFQRFRQMPGLFNQVAREADEVRRQRVYPPHDRLQVGAVALVMHVGEVDEPVGRLCGCRGGGAGS